MVKADLKTLDSDLRAEMAKIDRNLRGGIGRQSDNLNNRIDDLKDKIGDLREEITKLRVSMAWMTVAVVMGLGGLITLFQFLS